MDRRLILYPRFGALLVLLAGVGACAHAPVDPRTVAQAALEGAPIFDGHNDLAIHFAREQPIWSLERLNLTNLRGQSNLATWQAGRVGGALVTTGSTLEPGAPGQYASLRRSFDWFDAVAAAHHDQVAKVTGANELRAARGAGKIALIMAIEGGEQLEQSLVNLRDAHDRGVRSIGIVYNDHGAIGDGALPDPDSRPSGGLTPFGRSVIAEMNRLGMIVDLSHAAELTANQAIRFSRAPVLFSHSGARGVTGTPRNLSDETLRLVRQYRGLVMVPLVPYLVSSDYARWWNAGEANYARLQKQFPDDPERVNRESARWDEENPAPTVRIADVANHIDHVARIAGHAHVGIGTDFDGMGSHVIPALADASTLPALFEELARRGWSQQQLELLAGRNFERLFGAVERAAR